MQSGLLELGDLKLGLFHQVPPQSKASGASTVDFVLPLALSGHAENSPLSALGYAESTASSAITIEAGQSKKQREHAAYQTSK